MPTSRTLVIAATGALFLSASAAFAGTYDLSWFTLDGGGATAATGGSYELAGTIGQPDAGSYAAPLVGGSYELVGGFWVIAPQQACPGVAGDANCDGTVDFFDIDPFLTALFDAGQYQSTFCSGETCTVDIDCSGAVDFFDIDPFVTCLFGTCPPCP